MEKIEKVINREKYKKVKREKATGNLMVGNVKKAAGGGGKGSYGIIVEGGERKCMDGIMGTNATSLTICTHPPIHSCFNSLSHTLYFSLPFSLTLFPKFSHSYFHSFFLTP